MRVVFISLPDMLVEWMEDGLHETGHELAIQRLGTDSATLLSLVQLARPDVIVYAGPAGGPYAPTTDTFRKLRQIAPSVFLCFDASDVGWHGLLSDYRREECFDLIVNCDGCDQWPKQGNDITMWCPVGRSAFPPPLPISGRPIKFGFCGGHRANPRYYIVTHLVNNAGLTVKPRDDRYGTYGEYTKFLGECRIVLNIAFSAGGPHGQDPMTKQMKARVIETGFAGACLLETRGSATETVWGFKPGVDFLAYETPQEAAELVRVASPEYIAMLAANLHKRVSDEFSPEQFWTRTFGAIGL